ncbi:unnamed protein product [Urochloa decumbens]|uniref:Thioredoxin-dependent peroxiredoxin Q n=1 Tax=Urochloa decumbens TaxID=240449 RepID=A0ABC9A4D1_9POAL
MSFTPATACGNPSLLLGPQASSRGSLARAQAQLLCTPSNSVFRGVRVPAPPRPRASSAARLPSGDDAASHKAFAQKYRLAFTLLADEGNQVRKEWGAPGDLFGTLPGRQTYVLDKNGVVQYIYNNQFQPEKHIGENLKIMQSL